MKVLKLFPQHSSCFKQPPASSTENTMKNNFINKKYIYVSALIVTLFQALAMEIAAQIRQVTVPQPEAAEDYTWWYVMLAVLAVGLGGAIVWWLKNKKAEKKELEKYEASQKDSWEPESLDADKELEWLRRNQTVLDSSHKKRKPKRMPQPEVYEVAEEVKSEPVVAEVKPDGPLPVFGFTELLPSKPFSPLPLSNNESLLSGIEQTQEEDEEDEEVRDLAVRILAAFKNRNSVEALSQVALYDLSSSLRSKAVSTLADFDHESVFETILLAGADPTREVRAAAARGLSRLSFDRADAWARIAESGEEGRMRQVTRAAMEGGFIERSIDRLVHRDQKYAYEAFVLLAIIIKSGEVTPIFEALKNHKDPNVKLAILHVIKVIKNHNALDGLYSLLEEKNLPTELKDEVSKTIEQIGFVMA